MLTKVLRLAAERGTVRPVDIARALDISPELVRLTLAELVKRDYLHAVVPDCSFCCARCPFRVTSLYHRQPRMWILSGKGAAWLAQAPD